MSLNKAPNETQARLEAHVRKLEQLNQLMNTTADELGLIDEEKNKLNTALFFPTTDESGYKISVVLGELRINENAISYTLYLPLNEEGKHLKFQGYTNDVLQNTTPIILEPTFTIREEEYTLGGVDNSLFLAVSESTSQAVLGSIGRELMGGFELSISNDNGQLFIESNQESILQNLKTNTNT